METQMEISKVMIYKDQIHDAMILNYNLNFLIF